MLGLVVLCVLLQGAPEKKPAEKKEEKIKALVIHAKATDLAYMEKLQEPKPVSYPQRITVAEDAVLLEPLVPGAWRFLFDLKRKCVYVINDGRKSYYEVPLQLLRFRYFMLVERLHRWLENDRAAVKSHPDPAEHQKLLEVHRPLWLRLQNFLRNPEPTTVKSESETLKEKKQGMPAKRVRITADGEEVVTVTLAITTLIKKEMLHAIVGALGLPPAVAKELLKYSGLPLQYKQHLRLGPFHEIRRIEVERTTKTSVSRKTFAVPKGYTKVSDPPFVLALKEAKRKFGGSQPPTRKPKKNTQPQKTGEKDSTPKKEK